FFGEVDRAVSRRLRPDQGASKADALAGEDTVRTVRELLDHAAHESDFARADSDVTGRHVGLGADMVEEAGGEGLTEPHDFAGTAPLRVEVRATLAAAHRQRGERILECLLEGEELQDRQVYRRMKAQAALVGTDRRAVLDPVAAIHLDFAVVVN